MGVRETFQKKQSLTAVIAILALAGASIAIFVQARSSDSASFGDMYFTKDDGKTVYLDSPEKLMLPDDAGNPHVRAHVIESGDKQVVTYLSRMSPNALKVLAEAQEAKKAGKPLNGQKISGAVQNGLEYKKPGETKWVPTSDAQAVTRIRKSEQLSGSKLASGGTP